MALKYLVIALILGSWIPYQRVEGLRILGMFPYAGKSHFITCEHLMRGLAARGHQVDVYSHFPLKNAPPNYTDFSLRGTIPMIMNNMSYELFDSYSFGQEVKIITDIIGRPTCNLLHLPIFQKLINNPPTDPPYDIIIFENFVVPCYLALGRHLNIPVVAVVPSVLYDWMHEPIGNPLYIATEPSLFSRSTSLETLWDRLYNWFTVHYTAISFYYHSRFQNEVVEKVFGPGYPSVADLHKDISLVLTNHNQALNGIRAFTPAVVPIAGLHVVDTDDQLPQRVQKFLDESKIGFIYVSFGSMVRFETFPKADIKAFYETFEKIAPIRVLMKIAKPDELPPGLPSNVLTETWLPQIKVLKHKNIKAFVTHGGYLGSLEAIYHGVPMIGFPLFGDQYLNIEMYVKKNFAIQLDRYNITEPTFTRAILEILENPIYKKSAEKAGKIIRDTPMSPMNTAAFWIEYVARHGKDVLRSPIVDLPWWQVNLLDVYGFIIFILITVLFIIKIILTKLIALFSKKPSNKNKTKKKKN